MVTGKQLTHSGVSDVLEVGQIFAGWRTPSVLVSERMKYGHFCMFAQVWGQAGQNQTVAVCQRLQSQNGVPVKDTWVTEFLGTLGGPLFVRIYLPAEPLQEITETGNMWEVSLNHVPGRIQRNIPEEIGWNAPEEFQKDRHGALWIQDFISVHGH